MTSLATRADGRPGAGQTIDLCQSSTPMKSMAFEDDERR